MSWWPIPIFPDGSLANSVITTVWVGVFVVCLLNLRFGWVLSGLVVPGYLVPLLIAKPISAWVVLAEASLTYGLFWLLSERLASHKRWSSYFGRDRFMGLILVSVAVRLLLDGWLLPLIAAWLDRHYGWAIDWQNNLHSFGLIVVALLANQLYKPGFVRGMAQALVMIGITFLIVRFGLMELTNFRIGALVYLYEGFASSVLASPKAYIILIVTCFIASRMNLLYGWDFSGIMIPALLALQWYQPWKVLTSFVEAIIIYLLASLLLKSKPFASVTIEGARKVLLFFNISFAYKLMIGHALTWYGVEQRISDYYGFGYLLPTLIAIKAYEKRILPRVTRATAQISLMGAVAGSLIGFLFTVVLSGEQARVTAAVTSDPAQGAATAAATTAGAARLDNAQSRAPRVPVAQIDNFQTAITLLDESGPSAEVRALLREAGFRLQALAGGRIAIVPNEGAGFALLFQPQGQRSIAVMVPHPASAPMLSLAALTVFESQGARWLVLGGSDPQKEAEVGFAPAGLFARSVEISRIIVEPVLGGRSSLALVGEAGRILDLDRLQRDTGGLDLTLANGDAEKSALLLSREAIVRLAGLRMDEGPWVAFTPSPPVLAFIRDELIRPILSKDVPEEPALRRAARAIGLDLAVTGRDRGNPVVALRRRDRPREIYLIRATGGGPVLQLAADPSLRDMAARLFGQLDGRAMLIAPNWQGLEGADNQLLSLLTEVLVEQGGRARLTLQLRSRPSFGEPPGNVLALDRIEPARGGLGATLRAQLARAGVTARVLDRGPASAGLEIGPSNQLRYLQQAHGGRVAVLWVMATP